MSGSTGVFGGSWQDEGLWFSIVVQGSLALVFVLAYICMNSFDSLKKVLRPARPMSSHPRFLNMRDTAALFERDENEVAMRVSVFAAMQLLLLKYRTHVFLGGFFTAACLVVIFGTDTFISSYSFRYDTYDCKSRSSSDDCSGSGVCSWNSTASSCSPVRVRGISELTMLNITPTHFRGWLVGIFTVAFHIWLAFCLIKMMVEMRVLAFSSKTMPVQVTSEKLPLAAKSGSRSLRISITQEQCSVFNGTALSLFQNELNAAARSNQEKIDETKNAAAAAVDGNNNNDNNIAADGNKQNDENDDSQDTTTLAFANRQSIVQAQALLQDNATACAVIYQPPENSEDGDVPLTEYIIEENEIVAQMKQIIALQNAGETTSCCGGELEKQLSELNDELKEVHAKIKQLQTTSSKYEVAEVENQKDHDGNPLAKVYSPWKVTDAFCAIVTFDTAANAAKFQDLIQSVVSDGDSLNCKISGPRSHIIYEDLTPTSFGSICKLVLLITIYFFFLFFASAIIGFFGSIEGLASIPGLGTVFGVVVENLPVAALRILQAYLPVIALAVFQMLIPILIRSIAASYRTGNWEERETTSFKFMFTYFFVTFVILQTALQGGISQFAGLVTRATLQDVLNFIVSIFSPKGGYFFAMVTSSTVFSMLLQVLCVGNVVGALFLAPREVQEEKKVANEKPRVSIWDIPTALWSLMFSLGVLFHSTSPLLILFATLYFVSSYYTFRALFLDVQDRTKSRANPSADTSLSCHFATSQVKIMLLVHSLTVVGIFVVFLLKFMWGAAALSSVCMLISYYLWTVKWTVLDPMLNTTDIVMIEHYDHLLSRRKRTEEEKKKQTTQEDVYLPDFVSYKVDEDKVESLKKEMNVAAAAAPSPAPETASPSSSNKPEDKAE